MVDEKFSFTQQFATQDCDADIGENLIARKFIFELTFEKDGNRKITMINYKAIQI